MAWRSGRALGRDLRDRALADAGRPVREVAARFGAGASHVVETRQRLRDGATPPRLRGATASRYLAHGGYGRSG